MRAASVSPVAPRRPRTQTKGASGNKTRHDRHKELSRSREVPQDRCAWPQGSGTRAPASHSHDTRLCSPAGLGLSSLLLLLRGRLSNTGSPQVYLLSLLRVTQHDSDAPASAPDTPAPQRSWLHAAVPSSGARPSPRASLTWTSQRKVAPASLAVM